MAIQKYLSDNNYIGSPENLALLLAVILHRRRAGQ
jgi:hypothetical protein